MSKVTYVVSTMVGQNCIGILSSQCCPNTSDTALHKENICTMMAHSARSACANIAQENYLCNVYPQPMKNFAQENNLQCCLNL